MREIGLFFVGGVIGFFVDAGIVQLLVSKAGMDPYLAHVISFLCAATVTWIWNRRYTFAAHGGHHSRRAEWMRWMAAMSGGALVNYGTYALAVWQFPLVHAWPALGVAAGSVTGAGVNYLGARHFVFAKPRGGVKTRA